MANNPTSIKPTNPYESPSTPEKRSDAGSQLGALKDKAKDVASDAADKAGELAAAAKENISTAATAVGDKAEQGVAALGSGMESLAGIIREHAPSSGAMRTASTKVAGALETGGRYLKEEGLSGMADDMARAIRRNPIPAVLIGIGIGFLLARSTRS